MKRRFAVILLLGFILIFVSIQTFSNEVKKVRKVSLNKTNCTIEAGKTETLQTTISPQNAANQEVKWSTSNAKVAIVQNGKITALGPGTSIIKVITVDGNKSASCTVIVPVVKVASVSINKESYAIDIGETDTLTASLVPENASNREVTWESSNTQVVKVDGGKITGVEEGTAVITVTTMDGKKTDSCEVKVRPASTQVLNILVLNFDPIIEARGSKKLHQVAGWNDPKLLADGCISDFSKASGGYIKYKIAKWQDIDEFPKLIDGFQYDDIGYINTLEEARSKMWDWWAYDKWHNSDFKFDYEYYLEKYDIPKQIQQHVYDEVWVFGGAFFGGYESRLAGKNAYWCNSPGLNKYDTRLFPVMNFNYERGVGEMLEDFGHRMESVMANVYQRWDYTIPIDKMNTWEKFTLYDKVSPGNAGCGNIHFAPNSDSDYDWGNRKKVWTNFGVWINYPNLTENKIYTDCSSWGNGDTRLHHKWWFGCLPRGSGKDKQGYLNNWWKYFVISDAY